MKKRISIWLEEEQIEELEKHYKATGSKRSETVRRAVDYYLDPEYLNKKKTKNEH